MSKQLKKVSVLMIVILVAIVVFTVTSIAYNNTNRNIIIGKDKVEYDVTQVQYIDAVQNYDDSEGSDFVSLLNQPNVWCVQHNKPLRSGRYAVGEEKQIRNDIIAYILNHGPAMGTLPKSSVSVAQVALWQYFYENANDSEVKELTQGVCPMPTTKDADVSANKLTQAKQLLEEAKAYANSLGNSAPSLELSLQGEYLDITVGGNFTEYKIFINDTLYTINSNNGVYNKDANANRTIRVDVQSIAAGEAKVRIEVLKTKYIAFYRVLSRANMQRLIVVTNASSQNEVQGTVEKTQVLYTNVSLQKYITKVNNKNLTNNETDLMNRKNTYSTISETDVKAKKHPSRIDTASNQYKKENVVKIEAGDTVTYRIYVYNNSNITARTVNVRDKLLYWGNNQYGTYEIISITRDNSTRNIKNEWKYVAGTTPHEYQYTINNLEGNSYTYFDVTVKLTTYVENQIIDNTAYIHSTWPINEDIYRTVDRDYIKMKPYKVSLQKIVDSVNGKTSGMTSFDRWNSWESNANIHNNPTNETYNRNNLYAKHNNPVIVSNGDYVTYAIKVRNDGETKVNSLTIKDTLPEGLSEYKQGTYTSSGNYSPRPTNEEITLTVNRALNPGQETILYVTARVSESNMSTRVLKNYAEITDLTNQNNVSVTDETLSNNQDADYIQLKDITIAGTVWNDKAFDKKQNNYNGVYDESQENKLPEVKVQLYRQGKVISEKYTNAEGKYSFSADDINKFYEPNNEKYETKNIVTEQCERHIKAPYTCTDSDYTGNVQHGANYWKENSHYTYYIVFEYDGITYTNTIMGDINAENYQINSNAKEDNGPVKETRKSFNDRFSKVDNTGASKLDGSEKTSIAYDTKNEKEYIPQSNHIYNLETMAMQSSTNQINIGSGVTEDQLQHINLGLRGRDIFDLELTSDVYSTKVTVNRQNGTYNYNNNKVTVRRTDLYSEPQDSDKYYYDNKPVAKQDAANIYSTKSEYNDEEVTNSYVQKVRDTDISVDKANEKANEKGKYNSTGLKIEVTYKITVTNASGTQGTASKIINYYDSKYKFEKAYAGDQELTTEEGTNGSGYASRIITTPETKLNQGDTIDIYVVYTLNTPTSTLASLLNGTKTIPTYNMAEIYEYKTFATNNEATRGLLDKDSAPGSVETEKVRLVTGTSNDTTVAYYFKAQNLSNLKYEDDTYGAPTLYFTSDANGRKLSGVVFKDNTTTDETTRIKTGNGIKDDGEVGVYGATVELVELNEHNQPEKITNNEGTVRYTKTTNKDGVYTFENFLPGNYVIRYHYGDTTKTVLLNQLEKDINKYSFNGEDYQSTNNIGAYGAENLKLYNDITGEFEYKWYAFNKEEGVSTGTDNEARREDVTTNVTNFTDEEMTVLNNVRDGKAVNENETTKLISNTNMFATTPNFTLTVEETVKTGKDKVAQNDRFTTYEVTNMNFGISEVPVTTIDLQKHVNSFTITDSAGTNTIASAVKQDGKWQTKGNVIPLEGSLFDVSIEDERLQGARLEVTYDISIEMTTEKDFRNRELTVPTIDGIVDFVDNDLSYNETLGENKKYWKVDSHENVKGEFAKSQYKEGRIPTGTVDPEGKGFTTVLRATENNPILLKKTGKANCLVTLEKTLSATESTVENIITSSINTYEYDNTVEILKLDYGNAKSEDGSVIYRDRVRTPQRYIILAGTQHDKSTSETITIHPPTGANNNIAVYVITLISLGVLATGVIFIKKYTIKKG